MGKTGTGPAELIFKYKLLFRRPFGFSWHLTVHRISQQWWAAAAVEAGYWILTTAVSLIFHRIWLQNKTRQTDCRQLEFICQMHTPKLEAEESGRTQNPNFSFIAQIKERRTDRWTQQPQCKRGKSWGFYSVLTFWPNLSWQLTTSSVKGLRIKWSFFRILFHSW